MYLILSVKSPSYKCIAQNSAAEQFMRNSSNLNWC